MLGRGMVSDPGLALAIVAADRALPGMALGWAELQLLLVAFWALVCEKIEPRARVGRLKQWLNYLRRRHPQAEQAYQSVRTINDPRVVADMLGLANRPRASVHDTELLETTT
jgi:tRNA-dihydrouridine synthase C